MKKELQQLVTLYGPPNIDDDSTFISRYFSDALLFHPNMLAEIDYLPQNILTPIEMLNLRGSNHYSTGVFSRQEIADMIIYKDFDEEYTGTVAVMFAQMQGAYCQSQTVFPEDHWIHRHTRDSDLIAKSVTMTIQNPTESCANSDYYLSANVTVADCITLGCGDEKYQVNSAFCCADSNEYYMAFCDDNENITEMNALIGNTHFIIPKNAAIHIDYADLILGYSAYEGESGEYLDTELDLDAEVLQLTVNMMMTDNKMELLQKSIAIPKQLLDTLNNQSFTLHVCDGKLSILQAA